MGVSFCRSFSLLFVLLLFFFSRERRMKHPLGASRKYLQNRETPFLGFPLKAM